MAVKGSSVGSQNGSRGKIGKNMKKKSWQLTFCLYIVLYSFETKNIQLFEIERIILNNSELLMTFSEPLKLIHRTARKNPPTRIIYYRFEYIIRAQILT